MPRLITVRDYLFIARNNPALALLPNITLFDFVSVLFYYLRVINVRLHITYNVLQCCAAQGNGLKSILTQLGFSYFEFKIGPIKLGFSSQKQKFLFSNSQPTDSQSGVITITPKDQL